MNNEEHTFEEWFDILRINVLEQTGVDFTDEESVIEDYEQGRDVYDVIEEIADEYGRL